MDDKELARHLYDIYEWESGPLQDYAQRIAYSYDANAHGGRADVVRALIRFDQNCKLSSLDAQADACEKFILGHQENLAGIKQASDLLRRDIDRIEREIHRITALRGES